MNEPPIEPESEEPAPTGELPATTGRLTQIGAVVGTPGYIPPEQAFGHKIDGRSDLYALACVAWWLLTASEVFPRAKDDSEVLRAHVQDPVPSLRARVKGWLPQGLEDVILECLEKRASQRPASAREMITRLRAIHVPDEYAWTDLRAAAWWSTYRPAGAPTASAETPTLAEPGNAASSEQPTLVGRQAPPRLLIPSDR